MPPFSGSGPMSSDFESVYERLYQPNPDCHFQPRSRPVYQARPSVTTAAIEPTLT